MSWEVYTRGAIPIHRLASAFFGIRKLGTKLNGSDFPDIFHGIENKKLWWCWNREKMDALGRRIIQTLENPKKAEQHLSKVERYAVSGIETAQRSSRVDLSRLSSSQLANFYTKLTEDFYAPHALLNIDIDCVDLFFEDHLRSKINNPRIYPELSRPSPISYLSLRERDLMSLALKPKLNEKDIEKVIKKYWWTNLGWENIEVVGKQYFLGEINKLRREKGLKKRIAAIESQPKKILKKRQELIRKHKISKDVQRWFRILDRYTYLHDLRKEMQVKSVYALHRILLEIERRYGFSPRLTETLLPKEIAAVIKSGKLNTKECEVRSRLSCVLVSQRGIRLWSGAEAGRIIKREITPKHKRTAEIQGLGVTKGKVIGTVKVCNGYQQAIAKIKSGDILVTGMTLPDYLPAMKKAAAIVTDEGGITCHAAIVSRELGKVCIVRVKTATYVLKDGDKVKVDADKGIIKIL